ncbi:MAG: hypothetical protein CMK59_11695 [Proteobacteria bacterium]|nr:hypothetical protein [Pseudomonadota bacterium]
MADVLIVNKQPFVQRMIARELEELGHFVVTLSDGIESIEYCKNKGFDLALVDFDLAKMSGIELLKEIRRLNPSCLRILTIDNNAPEKSEAESAVRRGEITRVVDNPITQKEKIVSIVNKAMILRQKMKSVAEIQKEASKSGELKFLDEAFSQNLIDLSLQPIIDVKTNKTIAFEALIYSKHQILNTAHSLLSTVQKHNYFSKITTITFKRARAILDEIVGEYLLFLNINIEELEDTEHFFSSLEQLSPYSSRVVLEISGRCRLRSFLRLENQISKIHKMGFDISIDDVGSGYDSLSVLAEFNPKFIKADISTIRGIDENKQKQRLVSLLCRLASSIDVSIVAEGVESKAELETLKQCGDIIVQGYLFCKPLKDFSLLNEYRDKDWSSF